jgi:hypothetical protein
MTATDKTPANLKGLMSDERLGKLWESFKSMKPGEGFLIPLNCFAVADLFTHCFAVNSRLRSLEAENAVLREAIERKVKSQSIMAGLRDVADPHTDEYQEAEFEDDLASSDLSLVLSSFPIR